MKNNRKRQEGITLIALVVTIIVLLILAGVAIAMLTGDNGILRKTVDARDEQIMAQEREELQLSKLKEVIDQSTQTNSSDFANNLLEGWSGEDGTYIGPSGNMFHDDGNGTFTYIGTVDKSTSEDVDVFNITKKSDMTNAINNGKTTQIWNIQSNIEINDEIKIYKDNFNLTINGNGHTISGSRDTSSAYINCMFNFESYGSSSNYFKINNLNIVSGEKFRSIFNFYRKNGIKNYIRFNNVSIDHTLATSQDKPNRPGVKAYGAAIINNAGEIRIQNNFSIISGQNAWAAIDLDNELGDVSLIFASNAKISFADNRVDKKSTEPFIGYSRESQVNKITFTNLSSYVMEHVTKGTKEGWDLKSQS